MDRPGYVDVLQPLKAHQGHPLYPLSVSKVLATKRSSGAHTALMHAYNIADAMTDEFLTKRLK